MGVYNTCYHRSLSIVTLLLSEIDLFYTAWYHTEYAVSFSARKYTTFGMDFTKNWFHTGYLKEHFGDICQKKIKAELADYDGQQLDTLILYEH
ncbi:unnamed protein product [Adineta ricciae]|uniref:Uncharacterized protein n=1 Tax=Adineta ricciae TaxID=249248 RepID=A0A813S0W6_ADIRI|nr:unnamed protein product [Adineta ricciae]